MKNFSTNRTPHSALRTGFTLIELLVVIAIIALLAALIVGGASIANTKKAVSRATTELAGLQTAIERYHKAKGFYPPDNPSDTVTNQLFYELTGTTFNTTSNIFVSPISGDSFATNEITALYGNGITGFINSSADPSSPAQNFFGGGLRTSQYLTVQGPNQKNFTVLGIPINGPVSLSAAPGTTQAIGLINPWHYNYSHPTNNQGSYDLWIDVKYGGHTNRISNWSKDPQPL